MLLSLLLLASCEDPIDATTQWRINNESSFKEYASKEDYKKASIPGSFAYDYMKWLALGEGKEYPFEVSCFKSHHELGMPRGVRIAEGN